MVKRYKGGLMSGTEATTSTSDSRGMWGTVQATQARNVGNWAGLLATETPGPGSGAGFANGFMTVSNVSVTNSSYTVLDDTPNISTSGGYIKITGRGFVSGCVVYVGGVAATTTTFISSTEVRAQIPATSSNTLMVYVVNPDGSTGIKLNSLTFSGTPSWTTGTTLSSQVTDVLFTIYFSATSDSAVTYALTTGSSLPPGTSLFANGLFTGTVTGLSSDTTYSFSVDAIDAERQDTSRTFSVTFGIGDSGFYLTPLLLNAEANVWIKDSSTNNALFTVGGDTKPSAFSPYNYNQSVYFDGTGDYLSVPNFNFGTNAFTIEGWFYATTLDANRNFWGMDNGSGANPKMAMYVNSSSQLTIDMGSAGTTQYPIAASLSTYGIVVNQWLHIALVRTDLTATGLKLYINGALAGTGQLGTNISNITAAFNIGYMGEANGSPFIGYISNFRIVNGLAVYTGSFTVPITKLANVQSSGTNISAITTGQTVLLTCQDSRFVDNSGNSVTITPNGDSANKSFGPFAETDVITGTAYFDGSGDYLTIADNTAMELGAGDFCIECWIYTTTNSGTGIVLDKRSGGYAPILLWRNLGNLQLYMSGNGSSWSIVNGTTMLAMSVNRWYHVAVYRVGTAVYYAINGTVTSVATSSATPVDNATNWYIGTETNGSTNPWTGWIGDMRFVVGSSPYGASNFTPPTQALSAITNTKLLALQNRLGENNLRFIDESGYKHIVTRAGDAHQGSFSPFSPAGWSAYFNGSSDYLSIASSSAFTFAGDFTIEMWIYDGSNAIVNAAYPTMFATSAFNSTGIGIKIQSSGGAGTTGVACVWNNGSQILTGTTVVSTNSWYHIAVSRVGTSLKLFVNGIAEATATNSTTFTVAGSYPLIGADTTTTGNFRGYISNLRVVNGVGAYTGTFTVPTTALTATQSSGSNIAAITTGQTVFLGLQNNRFIDANTTPKTITLGSTTKIQAFSPFRGSGTYVPATHGGSAYFDGTGDYITAPNSAAFQFGTGDFTVECWVYFTTTLSSSSYYALSCWSGNSGWELYYRGVATAFAWFYQASALVGTTVPTIGQWYHLAVTRASSTTRLFVNGNVEATLNSDTTNFAPSSALYVGIESGTTGAFPGYISGVRVIKSQALFTGNFTIPTSPPGLTQTLSTNVAAMTSNVSLLTNFTNGGIIDSTARNLLYTVGTVKIRGNVVKYGTGSFYFDTSYGYVLITPAVPLLPTIGDYTVELWVYCTNADTTLMCINTTTAVYAAVRVQFNSGGTVGLLVSTATPNVINATSAGGTFAFNTWQHIAVVRYGGTHSVYVNGTSVIASTTIAATTAVQAGTESVLGAIDNRANADFASFYGGYIDDFRITRYARYTANFTAPTSAFLTK